jgi:hypothetical protein
MISSITKFATKISLAYLTEFHPTYCHA